MRRSLYLTLAFVLFVAFRIYADDTALDRYIAAPDPAYKWTLVNTTKGEGYTTFVLDMTSQTWRSAAEVDRPEWKHWVTIVRPDKVNHQTGFLFIGGGNNRSQAPKDGSERNRRMALETGTVVAELSMVPNQPLFFPDAPDKGRSEDDLIAYTRVKYIETHDPNWLVRLAMVKSGVRAMDAVSEFLASEAGGKLAIEKFVVAGGSKRGWTTWLVGLEDPRVVAIIPMVIDALNSEAVTRHHYEAYGFFSPALGDYTRHGLFPDKIGTKEYQEIMAIEDPYSYRDRERLKIPKLIINAGGDQYFLPDNSRLYFHDMPDEKYLRYIPNVKHNLEGSDATETMQAFFESVLHSRPRPRFSWEVEKDNGGIHVHVIDKPTKVTLWRATNPSARDFRLDTIGKAYTSITLHAQGDGLTYNGRLANPAQGFTAYFIELTYDSGGKHPLKFTTDVAVIPNVLPHKFPTPAAK